MPFRNLTVPEILRRKQAILSKPELWKWIGTGPKGEDFEQFVTEIRDELPGEIAYDAVFQSLRHMVGQEITDKSLDAAVWRLLGNFRKLQRDDPVYPWSAQEYAEWVPVQVLSIDRQLSPKGHPGGDFFLQSLSGTPCPMVLKKFWPRKFISMVSQRLGFSKPWGAYPFRDIMELVNFRLCVLVTPELSGDAPGFDEIAPLKTHVAWNRRILRMRKRERNYFQCPFDFPARHACWNCHVGLDRCPASTHPVTFVQRFCTFCNQADAWYDPAHPKRDRCIDCHHQHIARRRAEG